MSLFDMEEVKQDSPKLKKLKEAYDILWEIHGNAYGTDWQKLMIDFERFLNQYEEESC